MAADSFHVALEVTAKTLLGYEGRVMSKFQDEDGTRITDHVLCTHPQKVRSLAAEAEHLGNTGNPTKVKEKKTAKAMCGIH